MKKLLVILFVFIGLYAKGQDYYAKDLPEYTVVANDSTDVMYIDDSGIDKHIEMPTLIKLVSDSTNQLRQETADSIAAVKALIGGEGAWSVTGDVIRPASSNDTVDMGVTQISKLILDDGTTFGSYSSPTWSHGIRGNVYLYNNMRFGDFGQKLYFGSDAYIQLTDSYPWQELEFHDNVSGTRKLSDLIAGGTGDLSVRGTVTQYQIPYFYSDLTSVQGNAGLKYNPTESFTVETTTDPYTTQGAYIASGIAFLSTNTSLGAATVGIINDLPIFQKTGTGSSASIGMDVDGDITVDTESGVIQFDTTIYYTGAGVLKTEYAWAVFDSADNNRMFADSSVVAVDFGLSMKPEEINAYLADTINGEVKWAYRNPADTSKILYDYGVKFSGEFPGITIGKLIWQDEQNLQRIRDLTNAIRRINDELRNLQTQIDEVREVQQIPEHFIERLEALEKKDRNQDICIVILSFVLLSLFSLYLYDKIKFHYIITEMKK